MQNHVIKYLLKKSYVQGNQTGLAKPTLTMKHFVADLVCSAILLQHRVCTW